MGTVVNSTCHMWLACFSEDAADSVAIIMDAVDRMTRLINQLLDYSRSGRAGRPLAPVALEHIVEQARKNLETAIDESTARIEAPNLPIVNGDQVALEQLFQNLLGNAIKFRGEDPPVIRITAEQDAATWHVRIADNGVGIAPEHHHEIFAPMVRLHQSANIEGTGIGLATCKRVVDQHGGRIWVESKPGQGATFHVTLPALSTAEAADIARYNKP